MATNLYLSRGSSSSFFETVSQISAAEPTAAAFTAVYVVV